MLFLKKLYDMIDFLLPNYINEGKNQLVIAVGCTGGKHRSVTIARALYDASGGSRGNTGSVSITEILIKTTRRHRAFDLMQQ